MSVCARAHAYVCMCVCAVSGVCVGGGGGGGVVPACARSCESVRTLVCVLTIHQMGTADAEILSTQRFQALIPP